MKSVRDLILQCCINVFIKFIKMGKIAKFKFQRYFSSCRVTHLKSGGGIFSNNTIATVTRSSDDVAAWPCDLISDMVVLIHRRHLANICAYNNKKNYYNSICAYDHNKKTLVKSVTPLNFEILFYSVGIPIPPMLPLLSNSEFPWIKYHSLLFQRHHTFDYCYDGINATL